MNLNKKRAAILSGVAAIAIAAAGTVAWAAFSNTQTASAGDVTAETYKPMTVTGDYLGRTGAHTSKSLLPGDTGDVLLKVTNPVGNSVNGRISSIKAEPISASEVTGGSSFTQKQTCAAAVKLRDYTVTDSYTVVLAPSADEQQFTLLGAVKLDDNATLACSGMKFPLKYTVSFEATRAAVVQPANGIIAN